MHSDLIEFVLKEERKHSIKGLLESVVLQLSALFLKLPKDNPEIIEPFFILYDVLWVSLTSVCLVALHRDLPYKKIQKALNKREFKKKISQDLAHFMARADEIRALLNALEQAALLLKDCKEQASWRTGILQLFVYFMCIAIRCQTEKDDHSWLLGIIDQKIQEKCQNQWSYDTLITRIFQISVEGLNHFGVEIAPFIDRMMPDKEREAFLALSDYRKRSTDTTPSPLKPLPSRVTPQLCPNKPEIYGQEASYVKIVEDIHRISQRLPLAYQHGFYPLLFTMLHVFRGEFFFVPLLKKQLYHYVTLVQGNEYFTPNQRTFILTQIFYTGILAVPTWGRPRFSPWELKEDLEKPLIKAHQRTRRGAALLKALAPVEEGVALSCDASLQPT